jgi:hypothetical protein
MPMQRIATDAELFSQAVEGRPTSAEQLNSPPIGVLRAPLTWTSGSATSGTQFDFNFCRNAPVGCPQVGVG